MSILRMDIGASAPRRLRILGIRHSAPRSSSDRSRKRGARSFASRNWSSIRPQRLSRSHSSAVERRQSRSWRRIRTGTRCTLRSTGRSRIGRSPCSAPCTSPHSITTWPRSPCANLVRRGGGRNRSWLSTGRLPPPSGLVGTRRHGTIRARRICSSAASRRHGSHVCDRIGLHQSFSDLPDGSRGINAGRLSRTTALRRRGVEVAVGREEAWSSAGGSPRRGSQAARP